MLINCLDSLGRYTYTAEFVNELTTDMVLSFTKPAASTVSYSYDTAIKENRARIIERTEWQANFINTNSDPFPSPIYTGWTAIDSMVYASGNYSSLGGSSSGSVSTLIPNANTVFSGYQSVGVDNRVLPSPTEWISKSPSYCSQKGSVSFSNLRMNSSDKQFACVDLRHPSNASLTGRHFGWQERKSYFSESESGYPRVMRATGTGSKTFEGGDVSVSLDGSSSVFSSNGEYTIPSGTTVKLTYEVITPTLPYYNDLDVTGDYPRYTAGQYDSSIDWRIDTQFEVNVRPRWSGTTATYNIGDLDSYLIARD